MPKESQNRPTLWRTCRGLANRRRLRIFGFLVGHPPQTVSTVAKCLNLPLSTTSKALRLLESRSLLLAQRTGSLVKYSVGTDRASTPSGLTTALRRALREVNQEENVDAIFSLVTAFTHPRRIEIFRALWDRPQRFEQLQTATGVPPWALYRHLKKLEDRGFIKHHSGLYQAAQPTNAVQRELMRLAGS